MNPLSKLTNHFGFPGPKGFWEHRLASAKMGKSPANQDELVILSLPPKDLV